MGPAVFKITDGTAAGTVSLLGGPFYIHSWLPSIPGFKGGGVFIDPPLSSGRRLAFFTYDNTTERVDFVSRTTDGDVSAQKLAKLNSLLKKAATHWTTNGVTGAVWVEARSTRESTTRYAKIVTGRLSGLSSPFEDPYLQPDDYVVEPKMTMLLERRAWQEGPPGSPASLPLTGNQIVVNKLFDHSFESGSVLGAWTVSSGNITFSISNEHVYYGDNSGKIIASSGTGALYQDISGLDPGSVVTCTVRALAESGTAELHAYDGGGFSNAESDTTSSNVWTLLSVSKTVPGSGSVRFALEPASTGHIVYFDYAFLNVAYGKPATETTDKVYFLNGRNDSPITHIYVDDGGGFGSNLVNASLPYDLLPSSPQVADALYIGSSDHINDGGPFSNIVFNLTDVSDVTILWEAWDATGSWVEMATIDETESLSVTGEKILSIVTPANWEEKLVNGVTAYWIRGYVSAVGGTGAAEQSTFVPFTVADSYIEVPATNLIGDEPPSVNLKITNDGGAVQERQYFYPGDGGDDGMWSEASAGPGVCGNSLETMGQTESVLIRIPDIDIPQGAQITSAVLWAISDGADFDDGGGAATYGIFLEDEDDSPVLDCGIDELARTWQDFGDIVEWTLTEDWWGAFPGYWHPTPDIKALVQQITDKAAWTEGNAITIRITDLVVGATDSAGIEMRDSSEFAWGLAVTWVPRGLYTSHIIMGTRRVSRGANFQSVIPASKIQRTSLSVSAGENCSFIRKPYAIQVSASATENGSMLDRMIVRIPSIMATSFTGRFRAFTRTYNSGVSTDHAAPIFRYRISVGGESHFGQSVSNATLSTPEPVDLGSFSVPELRAGEEAPQIEIAVQATRTEETLFYIQDIVLIPADEWVSEIRSPSSSSGVLGPDRTIIVDSMDGAGRLLSGMLNDKGNTVAWQSAGTLFRPAIGEAVRVWFVCATDESIGALETSLPRSSHANMIFSVQADVLRRFNLYGGQL